MSTFAESLDSLWAVQKHDREIVKARKAIEKVERDAKAREAKLEAEKAGVAAKRDALRKQQNEHKELEQELQRLDARVKQLESQGTEAGNEAAEKQRARIDELEIKGLELIEAIAVADSEVEAAVLQFDAHGKSGEALSAAESEVVTAENGAIEAQTSARESAASQVVPELLQVYEEVNARHQGNAICRVEDEFCAGCQAALNSQLTMQVRARREILRCPNCTRILDA